MTPNHRIARVMMTMAFAIGTFAAGAAPASAAGVCAGQQATDRFFVNKNIEDVSGSANYFEAVRGDATIRALDICIGIPSQGLTVVLPTNIENRDNGKIFQLGFGRKPSENTKFVIADGEPTDLTWFTPSSCPPVIGNRYTFKINTDEDDLVHYTIIDQDANCSYTFPSPDGHTYTTGMDITWWGFEKNDTSSCLGTEVGTAKVNLAKMGYNVDGAACCIWRSGLIDSIIDTTWTCKDCVRKFFDSNDTKDYDATINDRDYVDDQFNVQTDY